MTIRIIGDVHQKYDQYLQLTKNVDYSVQIGDLGYHNDRIADAVDCMKHKFFPGNHDNHDNDYELPNCLGRFGYYSNYEIGFKFFFVSGGFSLDKHIRQRYYLSTGIKSYFENEELSQAEGLDCLDLYEYIKPDIVLSHEAPRSIVHYFTNKEILLKFGFDPYTFTTSTSELLDQMLKIHRPKLWIFGHYHKSWQKEMSGTQFILLNELEHYDIQV